MDKLKISNWNDKQGIRVTNIISEMQQKADISLQTLNNQLDVAKQVEAIEIEDNYNPERYY